MGDPAQVLDVMRHVLLQHMDNPQALPEFRVQRAMVIGKHSRRLLSDDDIISGRDVPGGLHLLMRSGDEYGLFFGRIADELSMESEADDGQD